MVASTLIRVVLPAPLGPKMTKDSPFLTSRSIPLKARRLPKDLVSPWTLSAQVWEAVLFPPLSVVTLLSWSLH